MNIVELGGLRFVGQKHAGALRPTAGLIQYHARGVKLACQHGHGMEQLYQHRTLQFVKELPLHHTRAVSVAQDAFAYVVFCPSGQTRRFKREIHTLDGHGSHGHGTDLIAQVQPHLGGRFAPRTYHVESGLFGQGDLTDRHVTAVRIGQPGRVQPLEEGGLEIDRPAVQMELFVANGEFTHAESMAPVVRDSTVLRNAYMGTVEVRGVR